MKSQILKNRFSSEMIEVDISFAQLENILKNPLKKSKEDCPLFKFVSRIDEKNDTRLQENIDEISALILDFDDNVSIYDFKQRYKKYFYYLYTTTSHSKELDKFRVILPLKEPIKYSEIRRSEVLEALVGFFEGVDVSSFRNAHNLPNTPKNPSDYYWFRNNSDELFCMDILKDDIKKIRRKRELESITRNSKNITKNYSGEMSEAARKKYKMVVEGKYEEMLLEIPSHKTGNRYNQLVSFVSKMTNAKFPDGEFIFDKYEIENLVFMNCKDVNVKKLIDSFYNGRN